MERATVIVAIPSLTHNDEVFKASSEEVPHLTLLYLGDVELSAEAMLYVQHAAKELSPFGMSVDYRGTLGEDEADVLFFEKNAWDMKRISEFRHYLLLNDEIKRAYDAATQHEEWTPHLTLGYPEKPAKEIDNERRLNYVDFDRVAVWTGDFEGPEFRLKYDDYGMDEVMAMSGTTAEKGALAAVAIFDTDPDAAKHYGKKGMRWGITTKDRAAQRTPTPVATTQKKPGKYTKSTGGKNLPAHEDAINALVARQKAKSSTTDALSNTEIRTAITRMELEQRYSQLSYHSDRRSKGQKFVQGLLGRKRYGTKDKRKFTDFNEEAGEAARKAATSKAAKSAADKATKAAIRKVAGV